MTLSYMASALFLALLFVKLAGYTTVSWFIVFSPYLALASVFAVLMITVVLLAIWDAIMIARNRKK